MDRARADCAASLAWAMLAATLLLALPSSAFASGKASEDVPVPGGLAALARALKIDAPDRARCLPELARWVYGDTTFEPPDPASPYSRLITYLSGAASTSAEGARVVDRVPVPLTTAIWNRAVFRQPVTSQTLFAAILSDTQAALLAHGLSALDDETLEFFADHPALVTTMYRRHAVVFASFAPHLHIRKERVLPPGGEPAVPLWEAVLNARVTNPVAFVTGLFASADGRIAYLYDAIAHLDEGHAAFALGLWIEERSARLERFHALVKVASTSVPEWPAAKVPFSRPAFDLLALLTRVNVERSGAPRFPSSRRLWADALTGARSSAGAAGALPSADREIDAAWLGRMVLEGHGEMRRERLVQFAFGQRAFASARANPADVAAAIGGYRDAPMLMLTLDRIGVQQPATYIALAGHTERLKRLKGAAAYRALAQFQGAVALIARMVRVGTIDRAKAERLLDTLALVPLDTRRGYMGAVASWLERDLRPSIAPAADLTLDQGLVQALAGPAGARSTSVSWEGQTYVFDLHAGEAQRLRHFRERRSIPSLHETIHKLGDARVRAGGQPARELLEAVDASAADALLAFAYAIDWSDAAGAARLDRDLHRRHGFDPPNTTFQSARLAWAVPRLVFAPGEPWRVQGSLLGLDVALAPLSLRTIDASPRVGESPMPTTDRASFVTSLGLLNVFALRDEGSKAIAAAVARGQHRVDALRTGSPDVTAVIDAIRMDGWRTRALRWSLAHASADVPALFSMTELLYLGGGANLDTNAWGMSALDTLGCLCTHVPAPHLRTAFVGRSRVGLLPVTMPDLNIRIAVFLHDVQLPAALAKRVLEAALPDVLTGVQPLHEDDWIAFVRRVRAVARERIEDYVAAVTATDTSFSALSAAKRVP